MSKASLLSLTTQRARRSAYGSDVLPEERRQWTRYMIGCGADRFNVRDDRRAVVASGVSRARAYVLVHDGRHFCEAGEKHTNAQHAVPRAGAIDVPETGENRDRHR